MQVKETKIPGVLYIEPRVFGDDRGYFFESFNKQNLDQIIPSRFDFVQDNESKSKRNVLRGLHFQAPPYDQGKLVRVISGSVLDVIVDIRQSSPTYGKHVSINLSGSNKNMIWIPPGMAHGFVSLEDDTIFSYKCTNYYNPLSEGCIMWNDKTLNIDWKIDNPVISEKDKSGQIFTSFVSPFL